MRPAARATRRANHSAPSRRWMNCAVRSGRQAAAQGCCGGQSREADQNRRQSEPPRCRERRQSAATSSGTRETSSRRQVAARHQASLTGARSGSKRAGKPPGAAALTDGTVTERDAGPHAAPAPQARQASRASTSPVPALARHWLLRLQTSWCSRAMRSRCPSLSGPLLQPSALASCCARAAGERVGTQLVQPSRRAPPADGA